MQVFKYSQIEQSQMLFCRVQTIYFVILTVNNFLSQIVSFQVCQRYNKTHNPDPSDQNRKLLPTNMTKIQLFEINSIFRSLKDMPKSVEDRMRELTAQFGLDYDALCVNDNTNCAW